MTLNTIIIDLPYDGAVFTKLGQEGFFWSDCYDIQDYGPFPSVYIAMEHYAEVVKLRLASKVVFDQILEEPDTLNESNNIINVDFKNRHRVG